MKCRLKVNVIADGKNYPRDSIIDDAILPERLKAEVADYELENKDGKVLLLRDLSFQSEPRPMSDGVRTNFPVFVGKGETLDLSQIPEGKRRELVEGEDYKVDWSFADQDEQRRSSEKEYLKQFETEQPEVPTGWKKNR